MDSRVVMLVDDNYLIRKLVTKILGNIGVVPVQAENGRQALETIRDRELELNLLITDVMMPEMDGIQLAREVVALQPAAKVLFISGYVEDNLMLEQLTVTGHRFLPKPFTEEQILAEVRAVLGLGGG
jgi:two-component system cell cycle sensor histidine kinase/response regulator CckA